jgi:hypothetical protein
MRKLFLLFMLTGSMKYGKAQQNPAIVWGTLQLPVHLSPKWQLPVDFSYRTIGLSSSAFQYTFRSGLRRVISHKWNVASGLAFFFTRTSFKKENHEFGREFRLWQEAVLENRINNNLVLQHRFRAEERFFAATTNHPSFAALRLRYRLAAIQTINEKWVVQLADEYMHQLAEERFSFQQNRVNVSFAYLFSSLSRIQAGYIWSKLPASSQHFIILTYQKIIQLHGNGGNTK